MSIPRPSLAVRWATPLALLIAALVPASASAAGSWSCESSAVRGTVLSALPLDPVAANRGQSACRPASAGISTPTGLPLPIALDALYARTTLAGPPGSSGSQVAGASAGVADLRVTALPSLPLPTPDLGVTQIPLTLPILGTITVDLGPALEGLLRPIPTADLLHVEAVEASASARCVNGTPQLTGSSTIAGLAIGGRSFAVDRPVTETVALIDTQSIDPSDIDLTKVVLPLGVDLSAVRLLLQPVLDSLPTISVPPTLAQITVTPKRQIRTAGRLTQRALDAHVSVAGLTVADLVVAEAIVGSGDVLCPTPSEPPVVDPPSRPPSGPRGAPPNGPSSRSARPGAAVADQALACTSRKLALIDVVARGGRVRLAGAADRRFAGRRVAIKFTASGKTVARPRVAASGLFKATAPLPARAIRNSNRARYQARIGREKSQPLKLARRVLVTSKRASGGRVTLTGRLIRPLPTRLRPITIKHRVSCKSWTTVARVRPSRNGAFRVTVDGPPRGSAAAYRIHARVAGSWTKRSRLTPTFSLPRYVGS
jgi:hypothetical protein